MDAASQQKIVGYFIEEANEHLETLEKGILELSAAANDSETINELFRAAHSVKGGAAMLGFTSIQKSAHRLEDAFKIFKDNEIPVDQKLETLFLQGYDVLSDLIQKLQSPFGLKDDEADEIMKAADPKFKDLLAYLNQLVSGEVTKQESSVASKATPTRSAPRPSNVPEPLLAVASSGVAVEVKKLLKQMLLIFKGPANPKSRKQLQQLCAKLSKIDSTQERWQNILKACSRAIANPNHNYGLLAPVVIKELKIAGDYLDAGQPEQIVPSQGLQTMATANVPQVLITLEPKAAAQILKQSFNAKQLHQLVQILQKAG